MVWIVLLVYKTGLVEQIELRPLDVTTLPDTGAVRSRSDDSGWLTKDGRDTTTVDSANGNAGSSTAGSQHDIVDELWKSLSASHWPTLFAYYNISLTGRYGCFHFCL